MKTTQTPEQRAEEMSRRTVERIILCYNQSWLDNKAGRVDKCANIILQDLNLVELLRDKERLKEAQDLLYKYQATFGALPFDEKKFLESRKQAIDTATSKQQEDK